MKFGPDVGAMSACRFSYFRTMRAANGAGVIDTVDTAGGGTGTSPA